MLGSGWSNRYVGIPFRDRGRDRSGVDCWGLVWLLYAEEFGLALPAFDDDYDDTGDALAIAGIYAIERTEWVEQSSPHPGDVVMIRLLSIPCHVGVIVDPRTFLHSVEGRSSCLERLTSPAWRRRVLGFYRHRSRS